MSIFCFVGDYLTFERSQQAINSQSDRKTPVERTEGLVVVLAGFHVQLNFMKLEYKTDRHGILLMVKYFSLFVCLLLLSARHFKEILLFGNTIITYKMLPHSMV